MAPNPIVGKYRLYKTGTNKLVQWLAKAASACCDISTIINSIKVKGPKKTPPSLSD